MSPENNGQPQSPNNAAPAPAAPAPAQNAAPAPAQNAAPAPAPAQNAAPAPAAPAPAPAQNAAPAQPKDNTGNWRDTISDPKLKEYADRYTSPTDLVAATLKMRDDLSQRIKPLDANASEEDRAKFFKAFGVPEKPEDYKIELPETLQMNEMDKAILQDILPLAHESGIPQAALNGFVGKFMEYSQKLQSAYIEQINTYGKEAEAQLRREMGADFEPNMKMVKRLVDGVGVPEIKQFFDTAKLEGGGLVGDHPLMVKFLSTFARRTGEGELSLGSTPEEKNSAAQELAKLNASVPPGSPGYTDQAHQAKLTALYERMHGRAAIVGGGQRVA